MKTSPIVIGLALVLAGQAQGVAQEPRMPEPTWAVGDMWTYATEVPGKPRQIMTVIVIGISENDYTIRTIQPDGRYEVDSTPRGHTAVGDVGIGWPLSVGQRWSMSELDRSTNPPTPTRAEATVDAYELITVPAGTLGAFRITIRLCVDVPQGGCGSMRLWIAPQAKTLAKLEIGREPLLGEARGTTTVLLSYAVAP